MTPTEQQKFKDAFVTIFDAVGDAQGRMEYVADLKPDTAKLAAEAIGDYNEFSPRLAASLIDQAAKLAKELNGHLSSVGIGRESSPVLYLQFTAYQCTDVERENIGRLAVSLAKEHKADEANATVNHSTITVRVWYD